MKHLALVKKLLEKYPPCSRVVVDQSGKVCGCGQTPPHYFEIAEFAKDLEEASPRAYKEICQPTGRNITYRNLIALLEAALSIRIVTKNRQLLGCKQCANLVMGRSKQVPVPVMAFPLH